MSATQWACAHCSRASLRSGKPLCGETGRKESRTQVQTLDLNIRNHAYGNTLAITISFSCLGLFGSALLHVFFLLLFFWLSYCFSAVKFQIIDGKELYNWYVVRQLSAPSLLKCSLKCSVFQRPNRSFGLISITKTFMTRVRETEFKIVLRIRMQTHALGRPFLLFFYRLCLLSWLFSCHAHATLIVSSHEDRLMFLLQKLHRVT